MPMPTTTEQWALLMLAVSMSSVIGSFAGVLYGAMFLRWNSQRMHKRYIASCTTCQHELEKHQNRGE